MINKFKKPPIRIRKYAEQIQELLIKELVEEQKSGILNVHMIGFRDGVLGRDEGSKPNFNSFSRKIVKQIYQDGFASGQNAWQNEVNKIRKLLKFRLTTEIND